MPFVALFVPNRDPLANPAQVFESECLARDDGFLHQGFADTVIQSFWKRRSRPAFLRRRRFAFFVLTFCKRWRRVW